ncbi:MAG: O-succinylhomoserine sulfhydrylase [Pelagibacteraceae bacterium]
MDKEKTKLVRGGLNRSNFKETSEGLFVNSGFVYDTAEDAELIFKGEKTGFQYTRYANPTIEMFEQRLALLDGAESCFATASGMAAVFNSIMCQIKNGDHIVSSTALFGSCREILKNIIPRYGVEVTFVDGKNIEEWKKAIKKNTKIFFFETPSNPCMDIVDIKAVSDLAKNHNIITIVDNILVSPVLQKPVSLGADMTVYSGTKHMDGQGRVIGGAILSTKKFREETLKPFLRHTGPCISPFNAWVLLKGLETIKLRVESQSNTALEIAKFLEKHKEVEKVIYPFLNHPQEDLIKKQQKQGGTVLSFYIKGGKEKAYKFLNNLKIIDISNNFGDAKSLAIHPATTTHRVLEQKDRDLQGIKDNLIRVSVGLEDLEDLKNDINNSLSK